jgi:hypothetical protein
MNANAHNDIEGFLAVLAGREPAGGLLEIRYRDPRTPARLRQQFHDVSDPRRPARAIVRLATHSDVYIGVAPRQIRNGGRQAVAHAWVLWADLDQPAEDNLASRIPVPPGVIVETGTPGHRHLYWPLAVPLSPAAVERANATLAHALNADSGAVVGAATILRPPHTRNYKHQPPRPVTLQEFDPRTHHPEEILVGLACHKGVAVAPTRRRRAKASDSLLAIAPARYVEALTGQAVPRHRKINCPLHQDRTPSLHVYEHPENGWHCYGCHRGGSVYDLAAALWFSTQSANAQLRGQQFIEVRKRLLAMFLGHDAAA